MAVQESTHTVMDSVDDVYECNDGLTAQRCRAFLFLKRDELAVRKNKIVYETKKEQ